AVRRQRDPVRPRLPACDRFELAARADVEDTVKIQLPRVLLISESRIGEISIPVLANHDVVWSIQALALKSGRDHFGLPVFGDPHHATLPNLAGVEPAIGVEGVTTRITRAIPHHLGRLAWSDLVQRVRHRVAEEEE